MKKMLVCVFVLAALATLAACRRSAPQATAAPAPAKLVMGTNAEFPPFEFVADNNQGLVGQFDGVDVALAKRIADEMGAELVIENMAFDALIMALDSGRIDFIAAAMTATDERRKTVDFTETYYKAVQYIIVQNDNASIRAVGDLNGKIVGVQQGTTGDFIVSDDLFPDDVMRYSRGIDAVLDLKGGKIDAIVIDSMPATVFVSANADLRLVKAQSMVIRENSYAGIKSVYDVFTKTIGVIAGSDGKALIEYHIPDATVVVYESKSEAEAGLKAAAVDVLMLDSLLAEDIVDRSYEFTYPENGDVFYSELFEAEEYAIAVKKGNTELLDAMNAVIEKMKANGEIDALVANYS